MSMYVLYPPDKKSVAVQHADASDPLMTGPSEQGQEERSLGGPSDPPNPQEAPSEAPQSHRVNPLSGQEEALAGPHPMGLMAHRGQHTPVAQAPRLNI